MNTYEVEVSLNACYTIDAPNEETAIDIAMDYFDEAEPDVSVEKVKTTIDYEVYFKGGEHRIFSADDFSSLMDLLGGGVINHDELKDIYKIVEV